MIRRILNRDFTGKDAGRFKLLSSRLLDLYQGHFLTEEGAPSWSVPQRECLRSKLIRHLIDAGRYWESRELCDRGIACYQRGLEGDDLIEDFYRHLMVCYLETQRIGEDLSVYGRCRKVLSAVLGLRHAAETEFLHHALMEAI